MESINIKKVISDIQSNKAGSFEELYEHLANRVFSFIAYRTDGREAALELTQDCFVELYKAIPSFKYQSEVAFYAFVFTIVRRKLAQYYVHNKKHAHEPEEAIATVSMDSTTESELAVRTALEALDETAREIIILHHWSRYTFAEIAHLINMTESAVRVRHHRARATLASLLTT